MKARIEVAEWFEENGDDEVSNSVESNDDDDDEDEANEIDEDDDTDGFEDDDDDSLEGDEVAPESMKRKLSVEDDEIFAKAPKISEEDRHLYKLPTVDELQRLRETQTLYHSNLFRMQMEELLSEASMKPKHSHQIIQWLNRFTIYVKSLPVSPKYQLSLTSWMDDKNIVNPLPLPESKGFFQFMPPMDVKFVGSFAAGTTVTTDEAVDVMLVIPQEIVQFKDSKDGRWLIKRCKYLSWLATHLKEKSDVVESVNWTHHLGDTSRPVLQVTPAGGIGKKWKVNLFPVPSNGSLRLSNFSPEKGSVSPAWYFSDSELKEEEHSATPHCNWASAIDIVMEDHLQLVNNSIGQNSNLSQGIKLVKIWLAQRGLSKGSRKLSGHVITMLIIHLLQTRKITSQMSGYQVFRSVILTLEASDWHVNGLYMKKESSDDLLPLENLHDLYEVVFMDPSGYVNLTSNLLSEDFLFIQHEARLALQGLQSASSDSFEFLFMKKVDYYQICDQVISIRLTKKTLGKILMKSPDARLKTLDGLGDQRLTAWSSILKVLKRALGDRVALLIPMKDYESATWALEESPKNKSSLVVGLVIKEFEAKTLLTKGPSADDPGCVDFRAFWGDKSELRRFQDGSFHEAVLWGNVKQATADRRLIPGHIAKCILKQHFGLEKECVHYICSQTEHILRICDKGMPLNYGTGEESTTSAIQAFDTLARKLRSLDLPLKITSVQSTSEVIRHTRVYPPIPRATEVEMKGIETVDGHLQFSETLERSPTFNYAIDVNVFLVTSGKWPDDLLAIQAIKAEFHKTIASLLSKEGILAITYPKFLQVLWGGYIFHIKVCYRREIYLSRLVENSEGLLREEDTEVAQNLEMDLEIMPRITTGLASVQADHPSFNCGVRLSKRWMASQLLIPHIPHMAVELLVAYLYTNPAPYDAPHTPHVLFLRFLALLANTDWKTTPILVNLRESFTVEDITELQRMFTSERTTLPEMFIATPYDLREAPTSENTAYRFKLASIWTAVSPSPPVIYRCKQLASASLAFITKEMKKPDFSVETIFRPSLDDFNVIIKLRPSLLSRQNESLGMAGKKGKRILPYKVQSDEMMPVVMFDPAQLYLRELRGAFDHVALFFHDEHGGDMIGVVWKPSAFEKQEVKVGSFGAHRLVGLKTVQQATNFEAIISDFEVIGSGLVESVTVNDKA